jgi:hypothetical protein
MGKFNDNRVVGADDDEIVVLLHEAMDQLRNALDRALAQDSEAKPGLIVWSIRDLADTIDLIQRSKSEDWASTSVRSAVPRTICD